MKMVDLDIVDGDGAADLLQIPTWCVERRYDTGTDLRSVACCLVLHDREIEKLEKLAKLYKANPETVVSMLLQTALLREGRA
jgi:hypothetical protein